MPDSSDTPDLPERSPEPDGSPAGMPDLNSLLSAAEQMGQQLMASQAEAAARVLTGTAGGGAVKVEITGGLECRSVSIAPHAVDPDDIEMLQDLVVAALNDALGQVGDGGPDLGGLDLGGLDLGGLGGLLGGGQP